MGLSKWLVIVMSLIAMCTVSAAADTLLFLVCAVDDAYDYLGRSYLHVPQDEEVDLRTDEPPEKCYAPKKLVHSW